jgi:hypothetical protein
MGRQGRRVLGATADVADCKHAAYNVADLPPTCAQCGATLYATVVKT